VQPAPEPLARTGYKGKLVPDYLVWSFSSVLLSVEEQRPQTGHLNWNPVVPSEPKSYDNMSYTVH